MNYFQLFDFPEQFEMDLDQLTKRYHALQKRFHPDRFVKASIREQHDASRYSALTNEAYQTLRSPLKRALYLLSLQGILLSDTQQTINDEDFLMTQMSWRQQLAEGRALPTLQQAVNAAIDETLSALNDHFSHQALEAAAKATYQLQFYIKINEQLNEKIG